MQSTEAAAIFFGSDPISHRSTRQRCRMFGMGATAEVRRAEDDGDDDERDPSLPEALFDQVLDDAAIQQLFRYANQQIDRDELEQPVPRLEGGEAEPEEADGEPERQADDGQCPEPLQDVN
jgi:hypothetical protein